MPPSPSTALVWRAKNEAVQAFEREQLSSYWQRIALADREWSANNAVRAQALLDQCPEKHRGWEWHYLRRLPGKAMEPLRHDAPLRTVAVSPDGKRCGSEHQVQLHHLQPYARKGPPTVENLQLRCRAHNLYAAEKDFGRDFMRRFRGRRSRTDESESGG